MRKDKLEYLNSKITSFTFSIKPVGTIFQKKVWMELMKIKYGKIGSYLGIANKLNTSPRAIGNACSKNPCLLVIPCHRIISISGNIGGFRLGINIKKELISMEMHKKYRL